MVESTQFHQGHLTVSEVMTQKPASVTLGSSLCEVAEVLSESGFRHVFVSDLNGCVVGVVSSNDLLRLLADWEEDDSGAWKRKTVESIMTTKFVTSAPDAQADDVAPMIAQGHIECVPILEGDKLVGVMTRDDLLLSWNRLYPMLQQAASDAVTELANRAMFDRRLLEEWQRAKRQGVSLGLIMIDIDHFKEINDTCGHLTGDAVLHMIGTCLKRHLRAYDVVARFAGDEFAAICCDCTPEGIDLPIRRLQRAARKLSVPRGLCRRSITLSIGAAVVCHDFHLFTPTQVVEAADKCLYRAKDEGRDRAYRMKLGLGPYGSEMVLVTENGVPTEV